MIVSILSSFSATSWPRLASKFLSGFVFEYSILSFSLILLNSSSVTADGSVTATLSASAGDWMSYFWVWGLSITLNAPISAALVPTPAISPPSASVALT